jgi:hypothetical protein
MAQNIEIRCARRIMGLIGAVTCFAAIGMVSLSGQALAHAGGGGGHFAGHGGYGHAGYGYGHYGYGYGHGGFYRGGRHYYYGADGVLVEDCCYAVPLVVAPPLPVVVAPFGVYVR